MVGLAVAVRIVKVFPDSPYLTAVKALWRGESKQLGFFPDGAFAEAAMEGRIAAALADDTLLGYVLYRLSQGRVMITHLAINPENRSQGVARALIERLSSDYPLSSGIGLRCRREYAANSFWPRVGFVAFNERTGRSTEGAPLTFWWRDHAHPGLFSSFDDPARAIKVVATIDANVFFDLVDPPRPPGQESLELRADWLQDEVSFRVTGEIYNDINRDPDEERRKRRRSALGSYPLVTAKPAELEVKRSLLRELFPAELDEQTASDLDHVARTAAADVPYFITRDDALLRRGALITAAVGVTVLAPTEFINRVDQLRREVSYRPVRLAGNIINLRLVRGEEIEALSKLFAGKDPMLLRQHLREMHSRPDGFVCQLARAEDGEPLALVAHAEKTNARICEVVLFRVRSGGTAETVARYLLHRLILQAAERGDKLIRLSDADQDSVLRRAALEEYGFVKEGENTLIKYCQRMVGKSSEVGHELDLLDSTLAPDNQRVFATIAEALKRPETTPSVTLAAEIEQALWPTKLMDSALPSFLLPIKPSWAERLFDEDLASQRLLTMRSGQLMAREGVYYRAPQSAGLGSV